MLTGPPPEVHETRDILLSNDKIVKEGDVMAVRDGVGGVAAVWRSSTRSSWKHAQPCPLMPVRRVTGHPASGGSPVWSGRWVHQNRFRQR